MRSGTEATFLGKVRRVTGVVGIVLLACVMLAPGARAHIGETFGHLWNEHIMPKLATPGTINAATNPVDWTKLKNVPSGLADGLDNGVDQAVSAVGGGPNPSSVIQFFGAPATVTVTSTSQRVLVTSDNGFGTALTAASGLNLSICHRQLPSGAITAPSDAWIAGNQLPPNTRVPMGMSRILQLPPGQYKVGLCGTGGSGWNNNDWGSTTALVFST